MTIDDQIRDEKLQYDINREAAKISTLSSGKIRKYEYLTGENILPSNQQQIIEQAKFTYSPLGNAFEKQTKTIGDQGEKQVKALQGLKPKAIEGKSNNIHLKAKRIFKDLINERKSIINKLYESIDYNNLNFKYVDSKNKDLSFYEYMNSKEIYDKIKSCQIKFGDAKNKQNEF